MKFTFIVSWITSILAAAIMLLTLQFKFTARPESVALFSKLGAEPWGRVSAGILELIASVLLLVPLTRVWGALLGVGLMVGAMLSHFFVLGIVSEGGSAELFLTALIVFVCCVVNLIINKKGIQKIINLLKSTS